METKQATSDKASDKSKRMVYADDLKKKAFPDPYEELGTAWAEFKTAMWNDFSESKPGKLFIRAADKFAAFLERRFHG